MPRDPYHYFRSEASDLVDQLARGALDLERGPSPELVARLLRIAHTLKGAARVVKQREIADRAHAVEDALAPYRDAAVPPSRELVDALLAHVDAIGKALAALAPPPEEAPGAGVPGGGEGELQAVAADAAELDDLRNGLSEAHAQVAALRQALAEAERARRLAALLAGGAEAPGRPRAGAALGGALAAVARSLGEATERLDRELGQAREAAERLRLVPAAALFTPLERAVRDAAQASGKRVDFSAHGGDVRLDPRVLAAVRRALLQVVGNAVVHGIESEAERRDAGKPPAGRVKVEVARRGRRVVFTCGDDGRGVDVETMRRIAQRRGLPAAEAAALGGEELLRLALRGGFSTSGVVTEMSGRGIGLDVVREAVERLGGGVDVSTAAGAGTTIELVVPLSLAAVTGLLVEAAGVAAAIPLESVRAAVRVAPGEVAQSPQGESIVHEGKVLPFLPLARAVGGEAPRTRGNDWDAPRTRGARPQTAVVVAGSGGLAAVGVERLVGTATVVLQALPDLAPAAAVVAGASLDGAGNPQLVLDPDGLVAAARRPAPLVTPAAVPRPPVLVIDDSLTTRMLEQSILESAGYEVDLATSGEEALAKARSRRYALFLVDIEMPGMDGFAFLERVRADPDLRAVPSLVVTSRVSPADRRRSEELGARGYVVKTEFEQTDLLARIRALVD